MLSFLTTTTFPNQKEYILIEEPTYSYYVEFLKTIDIPVITIPRNENGIDIKQLEYLFKNYPIKFYYTVPRNHNPLGTTFNVNTRKEIARLALEYDVYIIEDDYLGHCFSLPRYLPIYYYASSKNCIYLTSFSKTIPFLRIGICVIDPCLKKLFEEMIHESYYYSYQLPSLMSQATLESYISSELYKKQMQALNIHFNPHFKILKQITSSWDKNIAYIISDYTGYYFSVILNKKIDLDKLEDALLHKNILIARNERCFYYKENFNHSIRLSIARIEKKELEKALNIFYETAVNEYKKIM